MLIYLQVKWVILMKVVAVLNPLAHSPVEAQGTSRLDPSPTNPLPVGSNQAQTRGPSSLLFPDLHHQGQGFACFHKEVCGSQEHSVPPETQPAEVRNMLFPELHCQVQGSACQLEESCQHQEYPVNTRDNQMVKGQLKKHNQQEPGQYGTTRAQLSYHSKPQMS